MKKYQEHVNSEMEFMRVSLIDAHSILEEQTIALAEAHLLDEGSTMRIIELEKTWSTCRIRRGTHCSGEYGYEEELSY